MFSLFQGERSLRSYKKEICRCTDRGKEGNQRRVYSGITTTDGTTVIFLTCTYT